MRFCLSFLLFSYLIIIFGACNPSQKSSLSSKDTLSAPLLQLAEDQITELSAFILGQTIQQLQASIPIEEQQQLVLQEHPKFQQVIHQNKKEFTTWFTKNTNLSDTQKEEAIACLKQGRPVSFNCTQNPILAQLLGEVFTEIIHDVGNYSVQLVLDKQWIPANEKGYECESVKRGNFYYYMPGGNNEVVYVTRTDSSQRESLEKDGTHRRVTWTGPCSYQLTAWEPNDDFRLDFEIVHVASDHYLFLCKAPYKGEETTLLLGRVNKSLE